MDFAKVIGYEAYKSRLIAIVHMVCHEVQGLHCSLKVTERNFDVSQLLDHVHRPSPKFVSIKIANGIYRCSNRYR